MGSVVRVRRMKTSIIELLETSRSREQQSRYVTFQDEATSTLGRSQNGRRDHQPVVATRHVPAERGDGVRNSSSAICVELMKINNSLGLSIISCQVSQTLICHNLIFKELYG